MIGFIRKSRFKSAQNNRSLLTFIEGQVNKLRKCGDVMGQYGSHWHWFAFSHRRITLQDVLLKCKKNKQEMDPS